MERASDDQSSPGQDVIAGGRRAEMWRGPRVSSRSRAFSTPADILSRQIVAPRAAHHCLAASRGTIIATTQLFVVRRGGLTLMFINDTGRLPESGRVCVMGFQPSGQPGERKYYSLVINAARAGVEPMPEPRNAHHVL